MFNFFQSFRLELEMQPWWVAVFAALLTISWVMIKKPSRNPLPLPPGPLGLPLLGSLLSIEPQLHLYLTRLSQTYGPIIKLQLGRKLWIIISSPELAKIILKTQGETFANRDVPASAVPFSYNGADFAWSPNGPHWRKMKLIFSREMMSRASLDASYALRRRKVREMVQELNRSSGSPINIVELMFVTMLNVITSMLWGGSILHWEEKNSSRAEFKLTVGKMLELFSKPNISDYFPALARFDLQGIESRMKKLLSQLDRIIESVIADRMKYFETSEDETKDLLQILLELKHQGNDKNLSVSIEEIKALFVDIIVASTDSSASVVEWAMSEMLQHPEKMRRACEEIDAVVGKENIMEESHLSKLTYLDAFIKETLRLHQPAPLLLPHRPSKTCQVAGYTIPEGCRIVVNAWAIQRDPKVWESPEKFEPERFLKEPGNGDFRGNYFSYIPFGSGRRICAGMPIAEKMVKFVLATLLHSFEWKLPDGVELDMSENFGVVLMKTTPLVAVPTVRLPSLDQYL